MKHRRRLLNWLTKKRAGTRAFRLQWEALDAKLKAMNTERIRKLDAEYEYNKCVLEELRKLQ